MKNAKIFKIVSASLLAVLLLLTSACGEKAEQKPDNITLTATFDEITELTAAVTETEADSQPGTQAGTDIPEASAAESTVSQTSPATAGEIVALFNKSANRIKTEAVRVTKNYEKRTVNEDKLVIPASLDSMARSLLSTAMKDDTDPIVYETKEEIRENFLVPGQDYVSKVKESDILKATCTDNGKEYEVYMLLRTQKNPTAGVGVGAVCDVIEAAEVAEGASFVEEFSTEYYNCEVRATIDKATGRVTHANYTTPLVLKVTVNMFGTHNAAVGFTFEKDYTISY